jgi:hypothetical protein
MNKHNLIVLSDIHFTSLFIHFTALFIHYTALFIHFTALFIHFTAVFIHFTALFIHFTAVYSFYCSVYSFYSKVNFGQYNGVNRAVKWMSDKTMGKTEQYNECQTIQWGKQSSKMNVRPLYWSVYSFYCCLFILLLFLFILLLCLFILLLCLPHCIVWHSLYCSVYTEQ